MLDRRSLLLRSLVLAVAGLAAAGTMPAIAQDAPQLQMFVPAAPGGGWDQTARTMEQVLRKEGLISGAQITNVGGAGGTGASAGWRLGHPDPADGALAPRRPRGAALCRGA